MTSFVLFFIRKKPWMGCFHKRKQFSSHIFGTAEMRVRGKRILSDMCAIWISVKYRSQRENLLNLITCRPLRRRSTTSLDVAGCRWRQHRAVHSIDQNLWAKHHFSGQSARHEVSFIKTQRQCKYGQNFGFAWLTLGCLSLCINNDPKKWPM